MQFFQIDFTICKEGDSQPEQLTDCLVFPKMVDACKLDLFSWFAFILQFEYTPDPKMDIESIDFHKSLILRFGLCLD